MSDLRAIVNDALHCRDPKYRLNANRYGYEHAFVGDHTGALVIEPALVAALLDVVDDVRNCGHYDTCDSELTDAPCNCPRGLVARLDALQEKP